jgi:hypothetical protein
VEPGTVLVVGWLWLRYGQRPRRLTVLGAARRLGARLVSFIGLAEVLFAVLFAWALLGGCPRPCSSRAAPSSWPE